MILLCPRCGEWFEHPLRSALSRYHSGVHICSDCGRNEAMHGDWESDIGVRYRELETENDHLAMEIDELTDVCNRVIEERDELKQRVVHLENVVRAFVSFKDRLRVEHPTQAELRKFHGTCVKLRLDQAFTPGRTTTGKLVCGSNGWKLTPWYNRYNYTTDLANILSIETTDD